ATQISAIVVTSGQNGINYNFGDFKAVTVKGLVYDDSNGNNALNSGEPGIGGVPLTLSGTNGLAQAITATVVTAADGTYTFSTDRYEERRVGGNCQIVGSAPSG